MMKVFSVYDLKSESFEAPFFSPAVGAAVRMFADAVNDPQTRLAKHPADYQLFEVASYDDAVGVFSNIIPAKLLGQGSDFVVRVPAQSAALPRVEMVPPVAAVNGGDK